LGAARRERQKGPDLMQVQSNSPFQGVVGLGALKREWANTGKGKWFNLVFGLLCLAAAPALGLLAAYLGYNAYNNSGVSRVDNAIIPPLCVGAIALVVGALIVFTTWRNWNLAAALYEQGVAYRARGPVQQVRWDEIEAVWQAVTKHYHNGVYTGTSHSYTVQTKTGQKLTFNDSFGKGIELLGQGLQQGTAERLLPRYWQALQAGQKLTFGPLALDRDKLYADKKELPWTEIKAIKIERGNISIKKDKGWLAWANATVPQIPNFYVFFELMGRFAKIE
jgi:hypothetical protein